MIEKIQPTRLANADFIRFFQRKTGLIEETAGLPAAVDEEVGAMKATLADIDRLFINDRGSALSDRLAETDAERDSYITGLYFTCSGCNLHPDAALRTAAAPLLRLLEVYGGSPGITRAGYSAETSKIESFVADCSDKPDVRAAIDTLQLAPWIEALRLSNTAFASLQQERTRTLGDSHTDTTMLVLRRKMKTQYDRLVDMLNGAALLAGNAAPWPGLAARLNQLVEEYQLQIARRQGRAKAAQPAAGA